MDLLFRAPSLGQASKVAPIDKLSALFVILLAWPPLGEALTVRKNGRWSTHRGRCHRPSTFLPATARSHRLLSRSSAISAKRTLRRTIFRLQCRGNIALRSEIFKYDGRQIAIRA